ncbi:FAD/NAD(P)-dependent oxidoreductase [Micromonospora sp. CPCC 206061]|uniref:FAD/NAD(P)-dependent oxidoreductase n=1 Tax=Micromonospora sp. CPCC 206061 TaxID=3122410 RepID=UPI002FEFD19B
MEARLPEPDVVVVGAGPGGLAAAISAADAGAAVAVVDLDAQPGGQYLRAAVGHPLVDRAGAHQRITFLQRHEVWSAGPDLSLRVGDRVLRPGAVVLATGGYDRVVPFPGWDLPGVVTAGGAQALAKERGVPIGRRVLVAGTGPFLLAVAASLRAVGAEVVAVVEASRLSRWFRHPLAIAGSPGRLVEAARYLRGTALWQGQRVTRVERRGDGLRALVTPMDRWVEADAVCVGHGFTPSVELAVALGCDTRVDPRDGSLVVTVDDAQRSSVPAVLVAGEATGVGGAALAMAEGAIAGLTAAHHIGLIDDRALTAASAPHRRRRARRLRFADALHTVYPAPDAVPPDDTVLCRCERVTVGRARADVLRYGIDDVRALKLLTRVGMGMCQGRMCGRTALALLRAETGQAPDPVAFAWRPFVFPIPLGTLAEGGGDVA